MLLRELVAFFVVYLCGSSAMSRGLGGRAARGSIIDVGCVTPMPHRRRVLELAFAAFNSTSFFNIDVKPCHIEADSDRVKSSGHSLGASRIPVVCAAFCAARRS